MLSCSHKTVFANAPAMGKIGRDFGHAFSLFARHGRALTGVSPEHARIVGSV